MKRESVGMSERRAGRVPRGLVSFLRRGITTALRKFREIDLIWAPPPRKSNLVIHSQSIGIYCCQGRPQRLKLFFASSFRPVFVEFKPINRRNHSETMAVHSIKQPPWKINLGHSFRRLYPEFPLFSRQYFRRCPDTLRIQRISTIMKSSRSSYRLPKTP